MPHVKISYPHKAPDGTKRTQGDTVYVTSTEARNLVADGKGKIVTPSPEEVVKLAKAAKAKTKPAPKIVGEHGPETVTPTPREQAKQDPPKAEDKPKARKPADG